MKSLIDKADMVLANLASNGGLLNPEQSDRFYRNLMDQPTTLGAARTMQMGSPEMEINKIGLGTRILRAATENTGLSSSDRSKVDLGKVTLTTKEVIAELRIPYSVLEDNIEKGDLQETILALIAERAALDIEELIVLGDTGSGDAYLALFNGLLKLVTSHEVDASETGIASRTFSNALKAMPTKYKRNKNLLRFFVTHDIEQDYSETLARRQTNLGDTTIVAGTGNGLRAHGVPIVPCAMFPDDTGLLIDPQNIIIGVHRQFRLEWEKLISERQIKIVLTMRLGMVLEEEPASVLITDFNDAEVSV